MTDFCVYALITAPIAGTRFVKFGLTGQISRRVVEVQTYCPLPIEHVFAVACPTEEAMRRTEAALHDEHAKQALSGEWFHFPDDVNTIEDVRFALRCIGERELGTAEVIERTAPGKKPRRDFANRWRRRALKAMVVVGDAECGVPVVVRRKKFALDTKRGG